VVDIDPEDTEVNYTWSFGDGTTDLTQSPTHKFTAAQDYNVSLQVNYRDNSCPATLQKTLTLTAAPTVQITNPFSVYNVCKNDSLKLEVLGSFTSYLWGGGQTTPFIYAKQAGTITVQVTAGCTLSTSKIIGLLSAPVVKATATPSTINLGESTVLKATGLVEYHWKPNANLSDSLSATTNALPGGNTVYTVYGKDSKGCYGDTTVTVTIIADDVLSLLKPSNYFSPNGDDFNPLWKVENMDLFNQCGVTIFDERGFRVHEAKPYLNDWDGYSQKGQKLAAGVYFYIIRCDDSKRILTGSINLIR
jgi:gliding motility-associated-like protein